LTVSIIVSDTEPPALTFTPATLAVDSGGTGSSTLTATDNVGVTTGPDVTCTRGSFNVGNNTYTAPVLSGQELIGGVSDTCTATATDAAGNTGTAMLEASIEPPPDTVPPVVAFSPATLTVNSNARFYGLSLTATDDVGVTTGPDVTCDQGTFFSSTRDNPDYYTYFAPQVSEETDVECMARAFDAAGNAGSAALAITVTPRPADRQDTLPPVLIFEPATLAVAPGATVASTLTATDNVGVATARVVTCSLGSFNVGNGTYTAPDVSGDTRAVCVATTSDAAGNTGAGALTISITAPGPVVSFSPASLALESGMTGMSQVSATDAGGNVLTPTVTCTNGGAYDIGTGVFTAPTVTEDTFSVCTATATDGNGR
ncbi:MAG: hypothetical protein GDA39_04790, partial [Hyphomonadaceae bacterium]|nr:hypothetical protein [Hyphomonadaceae bacterium]